MKQNILSLVEQKDQESMAKDIMDSGYAVMQITVDKKSNVSAKRVPPGSEYKTPSLLGKVIDMFKGNSGEGGEA